jgi:hypothetical protein
MLNGLKIRESFQIEVPYGSEADQRFYTCGLTLLSQKGTLIGRLHLARYHPA